MRYDSIYSVVNAIIEKLGGTVTNFDSVYSQAKYIAEMYGAPEDKKWSSIYEILIYILDNYTPSETRYNVIFDIDSAEGTAPATMRVAEGTVITLPDNSTFTKEGYEFEGWSDGESMYDAGDEYTVTGDTMFVASFVELVAYEGLTLTALVDGSAVAMTHYGGNSPEIQYSSNAVDWEDWDGSEIQLNANQKAYFRGTKMGVGTTKYSSFVMSGNIKASGVLESLRDGGACTATTISSAYFFYRLFDGCAALTNASGLVLRTTKVQGSGVFSNMFAHCQNMVYPPAEVRVYNNTSSTYEAMFYDCPSLIESPVIADTTNIYSTTFKDMFKNCSSLRKITSNLTSWYEVDWVQGVAASGDFYNLGCINYLPTGNKGIPNGWNEHISLNDDIAISTESIEVAAVSAPTQVLAGVAAGRNMTVSAPSTSNWIHIASLGSGTCRHIVITCDVNTSTESSRVGRLYFSDGHSSKMLTVTQTADIANIDVYNCLKLYANADSTLQGATNVNYYKSLGYSRDGVSWSAVGINTISIPAGEYILLRGFNSDFEQYIYYHLNINGDVKMSGHLSSILDGGACTLEALNSNAYRYTFYNCKGLTDVSELVLPTGGDNNYVGQYALYGTFNGCQNITESPIIPAYTSWQGSLSMGNLFWYCTKLNKITTYQTVVGANNWVSGVASTGDFYNLGGATFASGNNGIPTGWTEHTSL